MREISFFIVGAAKSGSTALGTYLANHPDVFIANREPHFFARDLLPPDDYYASPDAYARLFADATEGQILADRSVFYLASEAAAKEIYDHNPFAKIIIMLRRPDEMVPSMHAQQIFNGNERIENLHEALKAIPERSADPFGDWNTARMPASMHYYRLVEYAIQVSRYLNTFPPEQVKVFLYDDFKRDSESIYFEAVNFLGLSATYRPDFSVVNAHKIPRFKWLSHALANPPTWIRTMRTRLGLSPMLQKKLHRIATEFNRKVVPRKAVGRADKQRIVDANRAMIDNLEVVLQRDLSSWKEVASK